MGHRSHAGVAALDEPETHPVAGKACRQRIHQCQSRSIKPVMPDGRGDQIEGRLNPLARVLFERHRFPREQQFEPGSPPMQLPHFLLPFHIGMCGHLKHGRAMQHSPHLNRIADLAASVLRLAVCGLTERDQTSPFRQGPLCRFREVLELAEAVRPGRNGAKRTAISRAEQDDSSPQTLDHAALQREPATAKGLDRRGFGEGGPEGGILSGIGLPRRGDRRSRLHRLTCTL